MLSRIPDIYSKMNISMTVIWFLIPVEINIFHSISPKNLGWRFFQFNILQATE